MENYKLGAMETKFADIIWNNDPISSGQLVKICEKGLEWKKSTTYTMLRRLCERGIFKNKDGIVIAVISKQEFIAQQSEKYIDENFGGSLPRFLASFTSRKKMSDAEIFELQKLINLHKEN